MKYIFLLLAMFCFLEHQYAPEDTSEKELNCINYIDSNQESPAKSDLALLNYDDLEVYDQVEYFHMVNPAKEPLLERDYLRNKKILNYPLAFGLSRIKSLQNGKNHSTLV